MQQLPILTRELTSLIERGIAPDSRYPDPYGGQTAHFGKTVASKHQGPWPPCAVFCFNGDDVERLREILEFFDDQEPIFYVCHASFTPEVGQVLHASGYALQNWKQTLLYGLPAPDPTALPPSVTIEAVTPATIDVAAEVAAQGNEWPEVWREAAKERVMQAFQPEDPRMFLACYDREPAGIGYLSKNRACERWCGMGNAAVVPRFRRRGIHTALLGHRLYVASQLGYELVISGADFDSTSFRNQQRAGMHLAYVESTWTRPKRNTRS